MSKKHQLATQAVHAGEPHDPSGAHVAPIHQTSTFTFADAAAVESYGNGETAGYMYSRGSNPTRQALAAKIAALEGFDYPGSEPVNAEIFGSGMGAVSAALLGLTKAGDHVITQRALYGSTDHLISDVLPNYGVTNTRVPLLDPDLLEQELAAHPETTVVYLEAPANPTMAVIDIARTAELAHAHGAKVVVDNTFATPILQRPLTLGADVVVHSTTKYINGHGTVLGGAVVSADAEFMDTGAGSMIRFVGAVPSPFDCWLTSIGLKTLPLRMKQHCSNARTVAEFLEAHPKVGVTLWPGLASHPQHALAAQQMDDFGAMITIDLGSYSAATQFLDGLSICSLAVSLGNVDTLVEHPASMTHRVVPPEDRAASGITDGMVRISVGIEDAQDLVTDLESGLANI